MQNSVLHRANVMGLTVWQFPAGNFVVKRGVGELDSHKRFMKFETVARSWSEERVAEFLARNSASSLGELARWERGGVNLDK